jgi:D-ribose pyranase
MIKHGILNPALASMLCRFRHTNLIVIADRGFPHWPGVETVDISLADDIPTVRQVLAAITRHCTIGAAFMATEFKMENSLALLADYESLLSGVKIRFEDHLHFKQRVPKAIGLIRTGDTTQYSNIVLESGRIEAHLLEMDGNLVALRGNSNILHANGGS